LMNCPWALRRHTSTQNSLSSIAKNWSIDRSHYKKTSNFAGLFNRTARPWKKYYICKEQTLEKLHFKNSDVWHGTTRDVNGAGIWRMILYYFLPHHLKCTQ
jgi:hypothetical protein